MNFDADIDLILNDSGDQFKAGGVMQPCIFNLQDEIDGASQPFPGQVLAMGHVLIRTSAFPDLKPNDPVSVKPVGETDFKNYRAALIQRIQEGRMMQVFLGKAA